MKTFHIAGKGIANPIATILSLRCLAVNPKG